MKSALITGILGQTGSYTAQLLHGMGYAVHGVVRTGTAPARKAWLRTLVPDAKLYEVDLCSLPSARILLRKVKPHLIFNYAGISNTFSPYAGLPELLDYNCKIPLTLLQAIVDICPAARFFQASSCLIFGHSNAPMQHELTTPAPMHPYGISKLCADGMVQQFRKHHGTFACSGIFYNHESPRRAIGFLTRKVSAFVADVVVNGPKDKGGNKKILKLGNIDAMRDYGYAPDFARAACMMLQAPKADDYVIGTGQLTPVRQFIDACFALQGLNYHDYVQCNEAASRPVDYTTLRADNSKIKNQLGWQPTKSANEIAEEMVRADVERLMNEK